MEAQLKTSPPFLIRSLVEVVQVVLPAAQRPTDGYFTGRLKGLAELQAAGRS